ncbi:MAG: PadR family transcriptional regulator [Pseudomonadota bacterium]
MNIRTVCLAILNHHDATGYEIRKLSLEGEYSYFVDASFGSIYPALAKLEAEHLVTSREEVQSGKPPRKVYSITEAGRIAFRDALRQPPQKDQFKSEFLLIAMCAPMMRCEDLSRTIDIRIEQLQAELDIIRNASGEFQTPAGAWTTRYGRTCITTSLEHLIKHRHELEEMAIQPEIQPVAEAAE